MGHRNYSDKLLAYFIDNPRKTFHVSELAKHMERTEQQIRHTIATNRQRESSLWRDVLVVRRGAEWQYVPPTSAREVRESMRAAQPRSRTQKFTSHRESVEPVPTVTRQPTTAPNFNGDDHSRTGSVRLGSRFEVVGFTSDGHPLVRDIDGGTMFRLVVI